jgi:hypothetical protein
MKISTRQISLAMAVLSLVAGATRTAQGGDVTYYISGNINYAINTNDPFPSDVSVGNSFTGSFTFDTSITGTQNGSPGDNNNLIYYGALTNIQLTVGSTTYNEQSVNSAYNTYDHYSNWANVLNNEFPSGGQSSDILAVSTGSYDYSHRGPSGELVRNESLTVELDDTAMNPTALSTAQLGVDTLSLANFPTDHYITFNNTDELNGLQQYLQGNITYLGLSPQAAGSVPEPMSVLLTIQGGLALVAYTWHRRRRQIKATS